MPAAIPLFSRGVTEACRSAKAADRVRIPAGKPVYQLEVPKRNSRLATPSRWRQPGRHRSGPPNSLEALTVMQRSFKPRKQGQYLPGEPNMLVMVYQSAFHPVKVTERVRIPLANPNFCHSRLRGRAARPAAATRLTQVRILPESPVFRAPFVQQPGLLASNEGTPGRHRDGAPVFPICPRSPTAEATRRDRVQCGCNSCRGHQISNMGA